MEKEIEPWGRPVELFETEKLRVQQKKKMPQPGGHSSCETDAQVYSETARHRSETLLNASQRLSKVGGWEWNVEKQTMFWTEETYHIHEFVQGEILPGSPEHMARSLTCYEPEDRPVILQAFERCARQGEPYDLEFPFTTATGRKLWIRTTGQPVRNNGRIVSVVGNIMDITERRRAEEALRQSEEKFRLAFQTSPDSINLNRLSDGMYIDINEGFTKLTGYTREDAIGKTSIDLNIWHNPKDRERLVDALARDGWVENLEAGFRRKNGQIGVGLMSARVLRLNQEDLILSITRDITERKQVEDALRESENRYHQLFEASTDAILVRSSETITHANPAALKLLRTQRVQDLVGKRYLDFVHPDDRPESVERVRRSLNENWIAPPREHRLITLDGKVVHVESTGVPMQYQGQTQHFGMFRDISARKNAEEALRENEERYRQIVESSTDAILVRSGEVIIYANPAAVTLFRASHAGELVGKRYLDLVHPDDRPESIERIRKGMDEKWIAPLREHRIVALDGQIVHVESTGVPVQYQGEIQLFGVFRDITARRLVDERLRETEKKYRELTESLPQVIFEVDSKGNLTYLNRTGYDLFGYTPADFADGFSVLEAFIREDRERVANDITLNIQGQRLGRQDYTAVKKDGTKFPVCVHANRVLKGQAGTGVRGILIDLTATKRVEEEKKKLEIQLQQAQKMEAIGALAGGIAHDFNNILSAIIGYIELAMFNEGSENCIHELKEALKASNRAKDLVKQILAFSRQTDEERMPVRMGLVAKEAIKFLRATIPTTIEIKARINEKSGAVLANSVELHQIIMNLCTNAVHAIGEKEGVLEIEVQHTEIDHIRKDDVIGLELGPYIRLSVRDTGMGMPPEIFKRIFDPYFTTKEKGVGTGLGLAVVHGIVKKSGGAIKVESDPGRGSAFHIYLPRVDQAAPYPADQPEIPTGGSERILFVDDEKMLADIGEKVLERLGYDVVSRTSPIEALELFKAKPDRFDLVITDQTMPGMTGDALAKELMRIKPGLPVIICTGYSQIISPARAAEKGIKALVMKPILINDIAAAIRKALNKEPSPPEG
jgi:PAS domain S-box-containing protein